MTIKYLISNIVFVLIIFVNCSPVLGNTYTIDTSNAEAGVISITGTEDAKKQIAVRIEKDGTIYDYKISSTNINTFPLQMGNGKYTVKVMENVSGTTYKIVNTKEITVKTLTSEKVFTNPIQMIDFSDNMTSIKALNALTSATDSNDEKAKIFYDFIVQNISYDTEKAQNIDKVKNYLPVLDNVYNSKKGICYDYSALFAGILRYNGIPAKLQMGYSTEIKEYHAWVEAFIDKKWIKIDTTYDAQAYLVKVNFSMAKNNSDYSVIKQY